MAFISISTRKIGALALFLACILSRFLFSPGEALRRERRSETATVNEGKKRDGEYYSALEESHAAGAAST